MFISAYAQDLPEKKLPVLSNDEYSRKFNSRWTFLNIFSLTAVRDIFILSKGGGKTVKDITNKVNTHEIIKDASKNWTPFTERQVLEYLNALVKFELLDTSYRPLLNFFKESTINSELSKEDRTNFESIFFTYPRFKEISSWFIDPSPEFHARFNDLSKEDMVQKSHPLYYYSDESRFHNTFLKDIESPDSRYIIKNEVLMRFWNVYVKWGTVLDVIEKFNISKVMGIRNKQVSIIYFTVKFENFDLIEFISKNFRSGNIWIPSLIFKIAKEFRYSINDIKKYIVESISTNDRITFERTSEIFLIKGKTIKKNIQDATYLYPLIDDFYISNLNIRR